MTSRPLMPTAKRPTASKENARRPARVSFFCQPLGGSFTSGAALPQASIDPFKSPIYWTSQASEASRGPRQGAGSPRSTTSQGCTSRKPDCPGYEGTGNGSPGKSAYTRLIKGCTEITKKLYVIFQYPEIKSNIVSGRVVTLRRVS